MSIERFKMCTLECGRSRGMDVALLDPCECTTQMLLEMKRVMISRGACDGVLFRVDTHKFLAYTTPSDHMTVHCLGWRHDSWCPPIDEQFRLLVDLDKPIPRDREKVRGPKPGQKYENMGSPKGTNHAKKKRSSEMNK